MRPISTSRQQGLVTIAVAALVCVLSGCSQHGNSNSTASPAAAGSATMTDAEIKYGVSPTRNSQVTYQDNVIVMEHGAEAVRGLSSNGLTYTIDGNAQGAQDIVKDKILFATGRVVGRVLEVISTRSATRRSIDTGRCSDLP